MLFVSKPMNIWVVCCLLSFYAVSDAANELIGAGPPAFSKAVLRLSDLLVQYLCIQCECLLWDSNRFQQCSSLSLQALVQVDVALPWGAAEPTVGIVVLGNWTIHTHPVWNWENNFFTACSPCYASKVLKNELLNWWMQCQCSLECWGLNDGIKIDKDSIQQLFV